MGTTQWSSVFFIKSHSFAGDLAGSTSGFENASFIVLNGTNSCPDLAKSLTAFCSSDLRSHEHSKNKLADPLLNSLEKI